MKSRIIKTTARLGVSCVLALRNNHQNTFLIIILLKSLTGLRLVIGAVKQKENVTRKIRKNIIKHEEKRGQKGANYAKNADTKSNTKTGMPISIMRYIRTRN